MGALTQADVITILIDILLTYTISLTLRVGLLSIAPVAFQGIGAYAFALLTLKAKMSIPLAVLLATLICLVVAALLSYPLGRVRGLYASIATLAVVVIATGLESGFTFTGGSLGLAGVPHGDTRIALAVIVVIVVAAWFWLDRSELGRRLDAIRIDPSLASGLSINVGVTKAAVLVASNTVAGLVGALYAHSFFFVSPDSFNFFVAVQISAFAIVAGATHWAAPLIAGGVLAVLSAEGQNYANYTAIATGVLMVAILVFSPEGLGGGLRRLTSRWRTSARGLRGRQAAPPTAPPGTGSLVAVRGVTKSFGGVHALRDISFELPARGVVGIIGPNGSGKSTLLATISGLLTPDSGTVTIGGRELTGHDARTFAAAGVARTFQQPKLIQAMKVWENLIVGAREHADAPSVRAVADAVGITDVLDAWPGELPASRTRRIEVARALLREPKVLLMDEPAAGLTEAEARSFAELVTEIGQDRLVILVEHNMNVISAVADRVIALVEGNLIADDRPEIVQAVPTVRTAYLGIVTEVPS
ncbi:MAG TPA: ATP-binding cassette domain-containing protein [Pseudonocardiaceae bacterium]|nr:ATP-binding cassette domain-containing protein [Pseudonocardiaceae bacterium]